MIRGRRILVAGGAGLIGIHLVGRLQALGAHVSASYYQRQPPLNTDRYAAYDFTRFEDCLKATAGQDCVCICAMATFGSKMMKDCPTAFLLPNLKIQAGLLEACARNYVQRVLLMSSSTVYQPANYPLAENEMDMNQLPFPLYRGIGWLNRYIEQMAAFYAEAYGLSVICLRVSNIFGPWDHYEEERSHVLPALIKRAVAHATPFVVWGSGDVVRDFLYVRDLIDDIVALLEQDRQGSMILNVANGSPITIRTAVEVILDVCGHRAVPQYDVSKPMAIPYRALRNDALEKCIGRRGRTSFCGAIEQTVSWYRSTLLRTAGSEIHR